MSAATVQGRAHGPAPGALDGAAWYGSAQRGLPVFVPPELFDGYRLVRPLARGAMGEVFLAHDTVLDRPVAIKFIASVEPDATARRRFLTEARAIARLSHPNIVTVHRVGEVGGCPFLVSELVPGKSLDRQREPLPWPRALALGLQLAQALAAAHRAGVLHRDVKPANVLLTERGDAKLSDFGLAKLLDEPEPAPATAPAEPAAPRAGTVSAEALLAKLGATLSYSPGGGAKDGALTHPGTLLGTPLYLAPELWRGAPATVQTDLFALGALLYGLCTGAPPHARGSLEEIREACWRGEQPPLATRLPPQGRRFGEVVDRCLAAKPQDRFPTADALAFALLEVSSARPRRAPEGNPYRGLAAFDAGHRDVFFGRAAQAQAVLELLRGQAGVVVAGDSGTGKSSLCLAEVLPAIEEGALGEGRAWRTVSLTPGPRPLRALTSALARGLDLPEGAVADVLRAEPEGLARLLHARHAGAAGVVVFVDQLEELLTLADGEEQALTARALAQLPALRGGVRVLTTLRGDFVTRASALPELGEALPRWLFLLRPLSRQELREGVEGPAREKGYAFESQAMVDALVDVATASPGALPLMQFALAALWDLRDEGARRISAQALAAIGGVGGALARHADAVVDALPAPGRQAVRELFLALCAQGRTRSLRTEAQLQATGGERREALLALVRARLLVCREDEAGAPTYEVSHEVLLESWGRLREWELSDQGATAAKERLAHASAEWERLGQSDGALWGERQLSEVLALPGFTPAQLGEADAAFLSRSRRLARRLRWARRAAAVALPALVLTVYGGVRWQAGREQTSQVNALLADAQRRANAQAERAQGAQALRTQAFARFDAQDIPGGEALWAKAVAAAREVDGAGAELSAVLDRALARDPSRQDVRERLAALLFERAAQAEQSHRLEARDERLSRLEGLDDTGAWRQRWTAPATLRLASSPPGATVTAQRYAPTADGHLALQEAQPLGKTPLTASLPPGSYRLQLHVEGRTPVRYPVQLLRGEALAAEVPVPQAVPDGYVFIPSGRFTFGSREDEELRRTLQVAQPEHAVSTGAYLISRTEVTFGDWLAFLDALSPAERLLRAPRVSETHGSLSLAQERGRWRFTFAPTSARYTALDGESLRYADRTERAEQDWRRFPVSGITWQDAQEYLSWLSSTGRLRGARLCTEHEWERAARGADGRVYPTGNVLGPADANHDATYGRKPGGFGPDEVGSHPSGDSPFGVADLAGNVWEWTQSVSAPGEVSFRGGGWYEGRVTSRSHNRELGEASMRDLVIGLRVCATPDPSTVYTRSP